MKKQSSSVADNIKQPTVNNTQINIHTAGLAPIFSSLSSIKNEDLQKKCFELLREVVMNDQKNSFEITKDIVSAKKVDNKRSMDYSLCLCLSVLAVGAGIVVAGFVYGVTLAIGSGAFVCLSSSFPPIISAFRGKKAPKNQDS